MKTIYVLQINQDTKQVYPERQKVIDPHDKKTNCEEFEGSYCLVEEAAELNAHNYNVKIASGQLILRECKDCGKYFFLTKGEELWYKERMLKSPLRCNSCRMKRKAQKVKEV